MNFPGKKPEKWLCGLIAVSLVIYLIFRINGVDMTIDESGSSYMCAQLGFYAILTFKFVTTNNHWLNSILMWISIHAFGINQATVRLPNVLAFCMYAYFCYRLLKFISGKWLIILSGFIILCANPYLLDYFSIGRGYGLSYAFEMGSLFYIVKFTKSKSLKYLHLSLVFALLSVLSSFILLHFVNALILYLLFLIISNIRLDNKRFARDIFLVALGWIILMALIICRPIYQLNHLDNFNPVYWAGNLGYWSDTLLSLTRHMMYWNWVTREFYFLPVIIAIVLICCMLSLYFYFRKPGKDGYLLALGMIMLLIPSLSSVMQHYIMGTSYLQQRTALFLFPLFVGAFMLFITSMGETSGARIAINVLVVAMAGLSIFHAAKTYNYHHTMDWPWDQDNRRVISDLDNYLAKNNIRKPVIFGVSHQNLYGIQFYQNYDPEPWLKTVEVNGVSDSIKFYYILEANLKYYDTTGRLEPLVHYPLSFNCLYVIKNLPDTNTKAESRGTARN